MDHCVKLLQLLSEIAVDLVHTLSYLIELRQDEVSKDTELVYLGSWWLA